MASLARYNAAMRYRLRTLLIVLALGPPVLAAARWGHAEYRERERQRTAWEEYQKQLKELEAQGIPVISRDWGPEDL